MSFELGRALLLTEAIDATGLGQALLASAREQVSLVRAMLSTRAISLARLEMELSRVESPSIRGVVAARDLVEQLPEGLCRRMMAIPIRRDPRTGTIEVVVPDLRDAHGAAEIGYLLRSPVRAVRAPLGAIERALLSDPFTRRPVSQVAPPPPVATAPHPPPVQMGVAMTPPPPSEELAIPLTRRSLRPPGPGGPVARISLPRMPSLVLDEGERTQPYAPDDFLRTPEGPRPITMVPPAALSVPPPPNTEPRPPVISSFPPAPPERATQPPLLLSDAATIYGQMRAARERDQVLELLMVGVRAVARRVAIFIARREEFVGWACTPEFGDMTAFKMVMVRADVPNVLSVAANEGAYLGPLHRSEAHASILRTMGSASRDVAAAPVRVFGRAAVIVMADDLGDTMIATRRMEELARAAGDALARIVRDRAERV